MSSLIEGAEPTDPALRQELAPFGRIRAAINYGNIVLAHRGAGGELSGVSVDLARELARRLGLELELIPFDTAGKVTACSGGGIWDVAFLAVDPVRAKDIGFTAPYVIIEGTYVVSDNSPLSSIQDFDRNGIRIAVGRGSAYDLYLTRTLKNATIVRADTSDAAIQLFVTDHLEAAAGVKQPLLLFARNHAGFRVIPGRFTAIEQGMGVPREKEVARRYLAEFVEGIKASGFVAQALMRHHQSDAELAPPVKP